jgi:predicted dehydrogenase
VVIAVPTQAHEEVALRALERGCPRLIEKPIAPTLERRIGSWRPPAAGLLVQVGHVERFNGAIRAAEPFLDEPLFVESHRLAPFGPRGTDVAVVLDLMIHDLDLVLSLAATGDGLAAAGVPVLTPSPDIANARLEFEGGGVANLTASRVSMERLRKFRFFQPSGISASTWRRAGASSSGCARKSGWSRGHDPGREPAAAWWSGSSSWEMGGAAALRAGGVRGRGAGERR